MKSRDTRLRENAILWITIDSFCPKFQLSSDFSESRARSGSLSRVGECFGGRLLCISQADWRYSLHPVLCCPNRRAASRRILIF